MTIVEAKNFLVIGRVGADDCRDMGPAPSFHRNLQTHDIPRRAYRYLQYAHAFRAVASKVTMFETPLQNVDLS